MATQKEVAEHLFLTDRHIRNLVKEGILPGNKGRSGYDLDSCREKFISYLRGVKNGQIKKPETDDETGTPLGDIVAGINVPEQEARKKKYDADIKEIRLQELRKELAPIQLLEIAVGQLSEMLVANLNALPMRMKTADPTMTARSLDSAKRSIADVCNEITAFELDLSDYDPCDSEGDEESPFST